MDVSVREEAITAVCIAGAWYEVTDNSFKFVNVSYVVNERFLPGATSIMFNTDDGRKKETIIAPGRELQAIKTGELANLETK